VQDRVTVVAASLLSISMLTLSNIISRRLG
jgi:hypothetical protein